MAAAALGLRVDVVQTPADTKGFVVLSQRWVVECSRSWSTRYKRSAISMQHLHPPTLVGLLLAKAATMPISTNP